jgi:hypothetical protein
MNTFNRPELDAKLGAFEARMDARWASIEADNGRFLSSISDKFARIEVRMDNIETTLVTTQTSIAGIKATIVVTGIAIFLGIGALNAAMLSNMLAAFESGRNTTVAQAEVKRQTEETSKLLKQIQGQVNQAQPPKK